MSKIMPAGISCGPRHQFNNTYFKFHVHFNYSRNTPCCRHFMHVCKSISLCTVFSTMKVNKSKHRSTLTDKHLESILKINTTSLTPNIEEKEASKKTSFWILKIIFRFNTPLLKKNYNFFL